MARGFLRLLCLLICAAYGNVAVAVSQEKPEAGGSSIDALCKNTVDDQYCLDLLKPLVIPSTNFSSIKWNRAVLSKAMSKARTARVFMTRLAGVPNLDFKHHSALKDCLDDLDRSVENVQQAAREYVQVYNYYGTQDFNLHKSYVKSLMDTAALDQGHCCASLDLYKIDIMVEARQHAEQAYKANKIAEKIVLII